ncbi:hypothetical protein BGZ58_010313 [Dissophora ornata]|nr:hypothetical protein BGZ58_010313 [Dissophora ornata]
MPDPAIRLAIKDLSRLLIATGLPLSGTKPVLKNRLLAHFKAVLQQIDQQIPQGGDNTKNINDDVSLDLERIKDQVLPQSIVSIDIGIRNLAWVELSKDGEILRWSIEDLLAPNTENNNNHSPDHPTTMTMELESEPIDLGKKSPRSKTKITRKSAKKKKAPALPFDIREVAVRLDKIMRKIVGIDESSPENVDPAGIRERGGSVDGVIVERQRFRTSGMHAVLDATFKCSVVEGMIHTWLAIWQQQQQQQEKEGMHGQKAGLFVESMSPRSTASWWGIGAWTHMGGFRYSSSNPKDEGQDEDKDKDEIESEQVQQPKLMSKSQKYYGKKLQSESIVDQWIYNQQDRVQETGLSDPLGFQVQCSPQNRDYYSQEEKRDDLSDALLQAIAWFEWRRRAIQEAVERSARTGGEHIVQALTVTAAGSDLDKKTTTKRRTTTRKSTTTIRHKADKPTAIE